MWLHFSNRPVTRDELVTLRQEDNPILNSPLTKPLGLWITDDSGRGWKEWCEGEGGYGRWLTHTHEVVLDESQILRIGTPEQIDWFTLIYAHKHGRRGPDGYEFRPGINWVRVAREFKGLLITPYIAERRFPDFLDGGPPTDWYYTWDCASGCIWDVSAISAIRLVDASAGLPAD